MLRWRRSNCNTSTLLRCCSEISSSITTVRRQGLDTLYDEMPYHGGFPGFKVFDVSALGCHRPDVLESWYITSGQEMVWTR